MLFVEQFVIDFFSFQPKRVSELPPLESESDSDDDNKYELLVV